MTYIVKDRKNDSIIASGEEDTDVVLLEGNWYFSPEAVKMDYLKVTQRTYTCPYKGICFWVDLETPDHRAQNIGWVYMDPKPGFDMIKERIGFYGHNTSGTIATTEAELASR